MADYDDGDGTVAKNFRLKSSRLGMIERIFEVSVPFAYVAADTVYGVGEIEYSDEIGRPGRMEQETLAAPPASVVRGTAR